MTLGENIARLRSARGMSQGALAEALEVSRQSVSKWETDGSVPELDKLIRLAKMFEVTLDELVTGEAPPPPQAQPQPQVIIVEKERPRETRKSVGAGLLIAAFAVIVLVVLVGGDPWAGMLLTLPLVVPALICFIARRNTLLWCLWITGVLMDVYLRFATGISWRYIYLTPHFVSSMNYMRLAIGWVQFFYMAGLCAFTVCRLRRSAAAGKRLWAGWGIWAILWLTAHFLGHRLPLWYYGWTDWGLLAAFSLLGARTLRPGNTKKDA